MRATLLTLALIASSSLMAQGFRMNGGLQVGLALPTGDFADKQINGFYVGANSGLGLNFGGHLDFNYTNNHQLRLHADAYGFASKEQYDSWWGTIQNTFGVAQFGADYVFNGTSPSKGGYFLVGLNLNQVKATYKSSYQGDDESTQSGRLGFRIGGGYTFSRVFSLEGHANSVSVEKTGLNGMGMDALSWVSVSCVFRFGR
jgi:hypothetical protein